MCSCDVWGDSDEANGYLIANNIRYDIKYVTVTGINIDVPCELYTYDIEIRFDKILPGYGYDEVYLDLFTSESPNLACGDYTAYSAFERPLGKYRDNWNVTAYTSYFADGIFSVGEFYENLSDDNFMGKLNILEFIYTSNNDSIYMEYKGRFRFYK